MKRGSKELRELHREIFFENQVHMESWKNSMAGKNEERCIVILTDLGYKLGEDYVRQHPLGTRWVIDFAFVKERVAVEIDGSSHDDKKQKKLDHAKDKFLAYNQWYPIRIRDFKFEGKKGRFWKNFIREVVEDRREKYNLGILNECEVDTYVSADYEPEE